MVDKAPPIDPTVWRASSPSSVKIPTVGSRVYYFPQGHAEQCSSDPDFAGVRVSRSCYLLQVAGIRYLADAKTDEVFIRISLAPPSPHNPAPSNPNPSPAEDLKSAKAHTKMLTQSDSNNGGGFSVLKACAMSIFPPLDYTETETPVQILVMTDLLGNPWKFRHVYRGNPRRHLLTTGWSKFVDAKNIVHGDTIVFIRKDEELFVGVRRRHCRVAVPDDVESAKNNVGFVRDRRGRVAPEAVVEAVKAAEKGMPFDVDFYPGKGTPEVVVEAEVVSKSAATYAVGATVRAKVATDNAKPGGTWRFGTVTAIADYDRSPWPGSPWRVLQVTWKDKGLDPDLRGVSPWEVELIPTAVRTDPPPHAVARILMPPPQSDSLATVRIDPPHATAKIPSPLPQSDLLATVRIDPPHATAKIPSPLPQSDLLATVRIDSPHVTAKTPMPPPQSDSLATAQIDPLHATAKIPTPPPQSDSLATDTTKMFKICYGPVRIDGTTGVLTAPPCDHNETLPVGAQGPESGPNVATVSNREGPPPASSRNDVPHRQGTTDSGSIAQGPNVATVSNREGPPPAASRNDVPQSSQVRLFGVTFVQSLSDSDEDSDDDVNRQRKRLCIDLGSQKG